MHPLGMGFVVVLVNVYPFYLQAHVYKVKTYSCFAFLFSLGQGNCCQGGGGAWALPNCEALVGVVGSATKVLAD